MEPAALVAGTAATCFGSSPAAANKPPCRNRPRRVMPCNWSFKEWNMILAPSGSRMLGLPRRLILDGEMRRVQPLLILHLRRETALENSAHNKRSLHRVRRCSGREHLFNFADQTSR